MNVRFTHRLGQLALVGAVAIGCSKNGTDAQDAPVDNGGPPIQSLAPLAASTDFWSPFDAAPSPDGDIVYFTAVNEDGAAVYRVSTSGGAPQLLASGGELVAPFGVMPSTDGSQIFIVDSGAEDPNQQDAPSGHILSLAATGGTPSPISGTAGTGPRSLQVVNESGVDRIYYSGADTLGMPVIYAIDAAGGSPDVVATGGILKDPSGLVVTAGGIVYTVDSLAGTSGIGALLRVENGQITRFVDDLRVGYPAGLSIDMEEAHLFVSGLDRDKGTSVVYQVEIATGTVVELSDGISHNRESAGVHRAHRTNVYAWSNASGSESDPSGGTVYLLKGRGAN